MIQLNAFFSGIIGGILFLTLYAPDAIGQCPSPVHTHIQQSEAKSFEANQGKIGFEFTEGEIPNGSNYRIRLYDQNSKRFVYDDNNPSFLNTVSAPVEEPRSIQFTGLSKGKYMLVLHGGACNQQQYEVTGNQ
jgi:hypothetical protein